MKNPFKRSKKVAEEKLVPQRTRQEINNEYATICAQIGDKIVKKDTLTSEITLLHARCRELNQEITALPPQEKVDGNTSSPK